ncbi:MAG TPA: tetratricopeptide repeat protein, partial [Fimbriimonas sp.]|nr:tetratricopeptide repeat protein [Fimbriimonas sp.]
QRTLDILTAVIEKHPDDPFQLFNLANTYFVANDFEKVVQVGKKCLQFLPKSGAEYGHAVFQIVITALDHLGRPAEGLAVCEQCDKTAYNGLINEFLKASVLLNLGRHDEALVACRKCLSLEWPAGCIGDKGIADFRRYGLYAQLLSIKGEWKAALEQFDVTLSRQPGYLPAMMGRAQALEKLGQLDAAKRDYLAAIADPRQVAICATGLGNIAAAQGNVAEAATYFEQAWSVQPTNEQAFFAWVELLSNPSDAFATFERNALASAEYLLRKAQVLESKAQFSEVIEAYASALQADPSSPNGLFSFGDFLYRSGAYAEAVQAYEQALRLHSEYPQGWFVLGNGLAQLGHGKAAARCYQQALVLDPTHESARANLDLVSAAA